MASARIYLGIDSSTTATKAIAFDEGGGTAAEASSSYGYETRSHGWAEQDPERWWDALCDSSRSVIAALGPSAEIGGIAITHQRFSFTAIDSALNIIHPAILWNDTRCSQESERARREHDPAWIFERTGYPPGQWTLYKLMWLQEHRPDIYERVHRVVLVPDYLSWKLTGELSTSESTAAMTGALDIVRRDRWAKDVITELGVRDDVWVEPIVPGACRVGVVNHHAAAETGIPEGTPVFAAAGDQPCGSLGAGVTKPGLLGINGGTSCSNEFLVGSVPSRSKPDFFVEVSPTRDYIVENDIPSGGSAVMSWYRDRFGEEDARQAAVEGIDPWERIFGYLDSTPAGNRGLMIVPYLQAVYGPYWNQNARGIVFGLHRDHTRGELVRGLLEGVAYEARRETELMISATGVHLQEIRMYGGSAKNDRWNQLFADVFGVPLRVPETTETTALGAAICAAVGSRCFASFDEAVSEMVKIDRSFAPDERVKGLYERYYTEVYRELYDRVADLGDRIATINFAAGVVDG